MPRAVYNSYMGMLTPSTIRIARNPIAVDATLVFQIQTEFLSYTTRKAVRRFLLTFLVKGIERKIVEQRRRVIGF